MNKLLTKFSSVFKVHDVLLSFILPEFVSGWGGSGGIIDFVPITIINGRLMNDAQHEKSPVLLSF